nr:Ig-like domain-containing protein [Paludisphaera mucosa]
MSGVGLGYDIHLHYSHPLEASTDGVNWFSGDLRIPETNGVVHDATVYFRISATGSVGPISGSISVASISATTLYVNYSGGVETATSLSPESLPDATAGSPYSQQLAASGGSGSGYVFSAAGVPAGLGLSVDGLLSGTPTNASGSPDSFVVTVIDGNGVVKTFKYSLVTKSTTIAGDINSSTHQAYYGQDVVLTASFSADGSVPMTGTVAFYDGDTFLGTAPMGPTGTASLLSVATVSGHAALATSNLSVGNHVITAIYSGDGYYSTATSRSSVAVAVAPATTSTTLKAVTTGGGTTLVSTVVVTSPGNPPLSGTVSFYDGNTLLGTSTLVDGVASLALGVSPAGSHTYSALFSGGGTSSASATSVAVTTGGPQIIGLSRYGFHARSTVLILYFGAPLDASGAQDVSNYIITDGRGRRIAVSSATYDPATLTVALRPSSRLNIHNAYGLTVIGTGSAGLRAVSGVPLDGAGNGGSGTNFVTRITWTALTVPGNPPAIPYVNGQQHGHAGGFKRYVDAVVRATNAAGRSVKKSLPVRHASMPDGLIKPTKSHVATPKNHSASRSR